MKCDSELYVIMVYSTWGNCVPDTIPYFILRKFNHEDILSCKNLTMQTIGTTDGIVLKKKSLIWTLLKSFWLILCLLNVPHPFYRTVWLAKSSDLLIFVWVICVYYVLFRYFMLINCETNLSKLWQRQYHDKMVTDFNLISKLYILEIDKCKICTFLSIVSFSK